ncbi:hypothetical protein TRICI_003891 [Trichomonascus ciferrii]|uniref:Uncharacterized protein n=1 Tax=Trichomonascus ciferrii TaxID=44093 RepID=A0A642V3R6_9ASCO|nr:hypothetical protein TRICI_003891 [Trichomonascus ciferrii]
MKRTQAPPNDHDDDEDDDEERPEKFLKPHAKFSKLTVWGHESSPDSNNDPFITGLTDWVSISHAVSASHPPFVLN